MLDRLGQFLQKAQLKGFEQDPSLFRKSYQREQEAQEDSDSNLAKQAEKAMDQFRRRAHLVERSLERLSRAIYDMKEIREELQTVVLGNEEQELTEKYSQIIKDMTPVQKTINQNLKMMSHEIEDSEEKFKKSNDPVEREMKQIYHALANKLKTTVEEYFEQQVTFRKQEQDKIKSRVRIVQPDISEEDLEKLADDPDAAKHLIQQQITGKVHFQIANAVKDIEMRHSAIVELSDSIEELHRMFQDVQLLVHAQGEVINTVQQLVNEAHGYLKQGHKNLREAKKQHLRAQRCKCYILICVLVLLLIIIFPIIFTQAL